MIIINRLIKSLIALPLIQSIRSLNRYSEFNNPRFFARFLENNNRQKNNKKFRDGLYANMLTEDIRISVMPMDGFSKNFNNFKVDVIGEDSEAFKVRELLLSISKSQYGYGNDLYSDAVGFLVELLVSDGFQRFEITQDESNYKLHTVSQTGFIDLGFCHFQFIPKGDVKRLGKRVVFGFKKHVWKISMPSSLGGSIGFRRLIRSLQLYSNNGPEFCFNDLYNVAPENNVDLLLYRKSVKIHRWSKTAFWGWSDRDPYAEDCTMFYAFIRLIRFNRSQALLREHILIELNSLLSRLNIKAEIKVEGLPTSSQITQKMNDAIKGTCSIEEAYKYSQV